MAISRPFAYNPSLTSISGATQVGSLAIATSSIALGNNSVTWWNGPDESLGHVIAVPVATNTQPTPISGVSASVGFYRTNGLTDNGFITLAQSVAHRNGTPQVFSSADNAKTWLNTNGFWTSWTQLYIPGLYKTTYAGYFNDVVNFFTTATPTTYGSNPATSIQTTSIFESGTDDGSSFSCQWLGYFKPTTTETYTFYTSSDDASYVWIGNNTVSGFTTLNAVVKNGGLHGVVEQSGSISLTAGVYYPIRIQFGESGGGDVLTFNFSTPTITKTTNVTGLVFYNTTTNGF